MSPRSQLPAGPFRAVPACSPLTRRAAMHRPIRCAGWQNAASPSLAWRPPRYTRRTSWLSGRRRIEFAERCWRRSGRANQLRHDQLHASERMQKTVSQKSRRQSAQQTGGCPLVLSAIIELARRNMTIGYEPATPLPCVGQSSMACTAAIAARRFSLRRCA